MSDETISSICVLQNALLAARLSRKIGLRLSAHGISFTDYLVMHYLNNAPQKAVPRIELAEHLSMSASGITRLLAPMEKNHIVEKVANARDARQSLVMLSATGQQLFADASVSFAHSATNLLSGLSNSQQERLVELVAKI